MITVLTIDDEKAVRNSIKEFLEDYDYNVIEAENGEEGIDIFKNRKPDAVLIDLRMPGLDGLEVVKILHSISDTIPLIVVSGAGEISTAIDALHNGAWDYILKPIGDMEILRSAITKTLARSRQRKEDRLYQQHLEEEVSRKTAELEEKSRQLSDFNSRLNKVINSTISITTVRRMREMGIRILDDFGTHLMATGGSIYFKEDEGLKLVHALDRGHAQEFIPFPLRENSVFKKVLEEGKSILINNIDSFPDLHSSGYEGYTDSSFMVFPLPDQNGNVIGLLSMHSKTNPPFVSEDKELGLLLSIFFKEATRNVQSEKQIEYQESRYKRITENVEAIVFSYSIPENKFDFMNSSFTFITGYPVDKTANLDMEGLVDLLQIAPKNEFLSAYSHLLSGESSGNGAEYMIIDASGGRRWLYQKAISISDTNGIPVTIEGLITDVSRQKEIQEELQKTLTEKDFLISEINHRVKNNMQLISSLLSLQEQQSENMLVVKKMKAARDRIESMALVHDNIYSEDKIPSINVTNYITKLISNMRDNHAVGPNIKVDIDVESFQLDLDRAVLCGLIINEVVSNSFTHAFPRRGKGIVRINIFSQDESYVLAVSDNGIGFKPERADIETKGLGLDIIKSLAFQLNGVLQISSEEGTLVQISFPVGF